MSSTLNVPGVFVTGTDTGAGKTHVSLAILRALREASVTSAAMKPVATGAVATASGLRNGDAEQLQRAAGTIQPYSLVNPYCFEPPAAPELAAREAGVQIHLPTIVQAAHQLAQAAQFLLIEGVGGWRVPLAPAERVSDLASLLGLPTLLVVGVRLGCINHAVLTAEAIRRDSVPFAGWVASSLTERFERQDETLKSLIKELGIKPLAVFDWDPDFSLPATVESARRLLAMLRSKSQ